MAGRDKRDVRAVGGAQGFGVGYGRRIVGADAFEQFARFVVAAFASVNAADVAFAQVGHGAADGFDAAVRGTQQQGFVRRAACAADDVDVEGAQEFARGVEEGGGVVVAGGDDDVAAGCGGGAAEEVVVERLGAVRRVAAVEDVASDDEGVGVFCAEGGKQPVEEGALFVVAFAAVEGAAEVPVGGVDEFQGVVGRWVGMAIL